MILGMSLSDFTMLHVVISLIGIVSGLIVVGGLVSGSRLSIMTAVFLLTTLATTLGGFLFPFQGFTPAVGVGLVSTAVLAFTILARYVYRLHGAARWVYAGGAVISLYLNFFVAVVQSFLKIPAFNMFAPTGSEPPFAIAQGVVLAFFVVLGVVSLVRFRPTVG
jgi:hypothetical protein